MKRAALPFLCLAAAWLACLPAAAQQTGPPRDSLDAAPAAAADNAMPRLAEFRDITRDASLTPLQKMQGYGNIFVKVIDAFDNIDPDYVGRLGYNFTAMLQATTDFEYYSVGNRDYTNLLAFAQRPNIRLGPYLGWKWLFLGYTFDLTQLGKTPIRRGAKFEFSIYTSMLGIDLIYRRTGTDFFLRRVEGLGDAARELEGSDCNDYISTRVTGINAYYNFNHRRFSNPAVFSQSTRQLISAGSWQAGASVTAHDISFNYTGLPQELFAETGTDNQYSTLERVKFIDYSLMGGYAYNWVFRRDWCLGAAFTPSLGYKRMSTKTAVVAGEDDDQAAEDLPPLRRKLEDIFSRRGNMGIDLTGRLGIVYNNGTWFAGLFGVVHNYNYHRHDLRFSNTFGTVNLCAGFYFQRKKSPESAARPASRPAAP